MEELHLEEIYDFKEDCKYGVTENKINIFEDIIIIYDTNIIEEYINTIEKTPNTNEPNKLEPNKLEPNKLEPNEKASKFSYEDMLKSMNLKVNQGKLEYIRPKQPNRKRIARYITNQRKIVNSKPNKLFFPEIRNDHYNEPVNKLFYVRRK
jgi:hypothetical protein